MTEVDKYLQSIGENGDELDDTMNGPNVHDCYKPLEIKIPSEMENEKQIDSPKPGKKGDQIVLYAKHMIWKRIVLKLYQKLVQ